MGFAVRAAVTCVAALVPAVKAATLVKINEDFGPNPTNAGFYIYVPDKLAPSPPVLVNPHWCHGNATVNYGYSQFPSYADKYGFIVIYPDSPHTADSCWDVSSPGTLSHNGTGGVGDSLGIVSMVRWTLEKYNGDAGRVFTTGVSSGAMMTNVLLGAYPDVFAAGSAWAAVAFGCFAAPSSLPYSQTIDYWNSDCANGQVTHTPAEWKAIVTAAYPTYSGWRPKHQVFHGTADTTLQYANFDEEIKQWTAVLGLSQTATSTEENYLTANWTRYSYGTDNWFWATSAAGSTHNINVDETEIISWFDLTCTGTGNNCFRWGQNGPGR
jgi:acetylxylan esterase